MAKASPVFVVGVPRSGTTLLNEILLHHPVFRCRHSPSLAGCIQETSAFLQFQRIQNWHLGMQRGLADFFLKNKEVIAELHKTIREIEERHRFRSFARTLYNRVRIRHPHSGYPVRSFVWRLVRYQDLLRVYFYFAQRARGADRLLEKTPKHVLCLPEIWATFPLAQVVFISRHPIDVYSSYRKRLRRELTHVAGNPMNKWRWLTARPEEFADIYKLAVGYAQREQQKNNRHFRIIKYEDLTADPQATMVRLCEDIGEAAELETMFSDGSDAAANSEHREIVPQTKNWSEYVCEHDAKIIEERLVPVMAQLGYSRYTR